MHTIDLTPFYQQVLDPFLLTVLSGIAIWLGAKVNSWLTAHAKFLGEQTDAALATGFNRALSNGVTIAMNQLDQFQGAHTEVDVKSWVAEKAAQYAINHSPDFMQKFTGMTPNDAAQKALAYLPPITMTGDDKVAKYAGAVPPKASPKGQTPEEERAETDDLNTQSAAQARAG